MQLSPGTRLGVFEITGSLGAGGMGEVYRARDTRLDRTVAIKILPAPLAADPEFRERFDREARAISQLDHPNICALYDVGQQDGTAYLVMPFLDGETLADRLANGPVPVQQALQYAIQMADALSRAHRAGIVHRDLKPGNIMLTKSGAKLLDFGLAKALPAGHAAPGAATGATTPAALTVQGTIVGTFHYMAPEQIEGGEADARSDVWAFGCVLYEMLVGARPFEGRSPASLLANILNTEPPPLRDRQPLVPRAVGHVVRRCLEKDPEARWQAIADVGHELRWAAGETDAITASAPPLWRRPAYAAALGAILAAAGAAAAWKAVPGAPTATGAPLKLMLPVPTGLEFTPFGSFGNPHYALSPDGKRIAFVAAGTGRPPSLWLSALDSRVPREIAGSDDASSPFWSSDSRSVGFFAEGRLKAIALDGERPRTLSSILVDASGATWHGDVILVGRGSGTVLRVPAGGGAAAEATALRPEGGGHRWPQFLPDGRHFIYTETRGGVRIAALDTSESRELLSTNAGTAVFDRAGFLLQAPRDSAILLAHPLDLSTYRAAGPERQVLDQVRYSPGSGYPPVSVSDDGLLAYWDGTTVATHLEWYDRRGTRLPALSAPPEARGAFALSPDGRQLAFSRGGAGGNTPAGIWLMGGTGAMSRFSFTTTGATFPVWAADGRTIFFTSADDRGLVLLRRPVGGDAAEQIVGTIPYTGTLTTGVGLLGNYFATDWSRDGRTALLSLSRPGSGRDVMAYSVATGQLTPLFAGVGYEVQARFSPDNRWIAYASNEIGRWEIFVEPFPPSGSKWQVSTDGGSQPVWRRDGKELFFLAPDRKLMAAAVEPSGMFASGKPHVLFQTAMRPTYAPYPARYDVAPDGQRFLMEAVRPGTAPTISIVVNWRAAVEAER